MTTNDPRQTRCRTTRLPSSAWRQVPGADSVSGFWDNLREGRESIVTLSETICWPGRQREGAGEPRNVAARRADAGHRRVRRRVLRLKPCRPRARWTPSTGCSCRRPTALEDAGYTPPKIDASVGVFATSTTSGYLLHNLMSHHDPEAIIGKGTSLRHGQPVDAERQDYLATRVAYRFNPGAARPCRCRPPAPRRWSRCTGLPEHPQRRVRHGAGGCGVSAHPAPRRLLARPGSMVSATGHCRPFDVRPTAPGLLQRRASSSSGAAGRDRRRRPHPRGHPRLGAEQRQLDKDDLRGADGGRSGRRRGRGARGRRGSTPPPSAVETHGTGTPLGDPIEIEALRQVFEISGETPRPVLHRLGQVNIGHLGRRPGMAALIKTIRA